MCRCARMPGFGRKNILEYKAIALCRVKWNVCVHSYTHVCTHVHTYVHTHAYRHKYARGNAYSGNCSSLGSVFPFALSEMCRCSRAVWDLLQLSIQTQFLLALSEVLPRCCFLPLSHATWGCARRRLMGWAWHRVSPSSTHGVLPPCRICRGVCHCHSYAPTLPPIPALRVSVHSPWPRPHPVALNEKTWL